MTRVSRLQKSPAPIAPDSFLAPDPRDRFGRCLKLKVSHVQTVTEAGTHSSADIRTRTASATRGIIAVVSRVMAILREAIAVKTGQNSVLDLADITAFAALSCSVLRMMTRRVRRCFILPGESLERQ